MGHVMHCCNGAFYPNEELLQYLHLAGRLNFGSHAMLFVRDRIAHVSLA